MPLAAGQPVITYDVPAVVASGRNPIIPVIVMDKKALNYKSVYGAVDVTGWYSSVYGASGSDEAGHAHVAKV